MTLGRLAPLYYALRTGPAVPRLERRSGAPDRRGTGEAQPRFAFSQRTREFPVVPLMMRRFVKASNHNGEGSAL